LITFAGVTKRYGDKIAVDNLDLTVQSGEAVMLVGPSGCGKTTTLKMINRLIEPTSGVIAIDGVDTATRDVIELRRSIGYVIQQVGLFPHLNVSDNVATVMRLVGWDKARIRTRVAELLELVGLPPTEFAHRLPGELSGGQQQRVGVARALAIDPLMLLMDEPFGAIDPITRDRLQDELLRLQRVVRKTIVFVTHDIEEALRLATQIAVMDQGRIAQLGSPLDLLEHPASDFVADFVGRQGIGLKLLSVRKIVDRLRPGETAEGEPLCLDTSLRDAFSAMTARHTDRLPVCDAEGRAVGVIALADLVR
jgi:osmoprotectant transport system ATP-binding protein